MERQDPSELGNQVCDKCKIDLPMTKFSFMKLAGKYSYVCRDCINAYMRAWNKRTGGARKASKRYYIKKCRLKNQSRNLP
jgi:hypothetical protein